MKTMKWGIMSFLAVILLAFIAPENTSSWGTDIDQAKSSAKAENKSILLSFSGSDWCGNCMRLERTLFESEAFQAFAAEHFVLLRADFPMKKKNKLSAEQTAHNEALAEKYNKSGAFPTVVILDNEGNEIGRLAHPKDDAESYINNLKNILSRG